MKGVDLRQIINKHYFGTDITEMKVDDKGQVAYQGKRGLEFLTNSSDSERDKEVNRNHWMWLPARYFFTGFFQLNEVSPTIFIDTRFNINHAEYTWDDGTKIELEEWLNVPGPVGPDFVPISPGYPYIPKWIILRYFKDVNLLFKLSRTVQNNDPCEIERPMIPACFTSRFKLIVKENVALLLLLFIEWLSLALDGTGVYR